MISTAHHPLPATDGRGAARRWRRHAASTLVCAVLLVACGGGNDVKDPGTFTLPNEDVVGAACASCRPGHLVGTAATGAPLVDAQVQVTDAQGGLRSGFTDAAGRYALDVQGLAGPMLVQVRGLANGQPVVMHAPAVVLDVGQREVHLNPLTELLAAFILGAPPADLLAAGSVDYQRISFATLRDQRERVRAMVQPVLQLVQAGNADPRTGSFEADRSGLDAAYELLELRRVPEGYRLRSIGSADGLLVAPGQPSGTQGTLPPLQGRDGDAALAALGALGDIDATLRALTQQFEAGLPSPEALQGMLSASFRHTGLDAAAFVRDVLLRQDDASVGAFSLQGARFRHPRLLEVDGASAERLRVRFEVAPRTPWPAHAEELWMRRQGGRWVWEGDGGLGFVGLRLLAVLGPQPLGAAGVQALPGVQCGLADTDTAAAPGCRIPNVPGDATAGYLDMGTPGDPQFGLMALYRSRSTTWQERLAQNRDRSRFLGAASARVTRHLAFEIDSRRIDARVQRVRVTGRGLPAEGLELVRPTADFAGTPFAHWSLAQRSMQDWHAVEVDRCDHAQDVSACRAAWSALRAGESYTFAFHDAADALLGTQALTLSHAPETAAVLWSQRASLFTRFDIEAQPAQWPSYARATATTTGGGVAYAWSWRAATGTRPLSARVELQTGDPLTWQTQTILRVDASDAMSGSSSSGTWQPVLPVADGWQPLWLSARLENSDSLGNRYLHYIAPNNPH